MFDEEVELNSHHVNKKIKAHILPDEEMEKIGFRDSGNYWYFGRTLKYDGKYCDISFNVNIYKDGSDLNIYVIDEMFIQNYDYQLYLNRNPKHEYALVILEQVEELMDYLQSKGVLSGHNRYEYI